MAYDLAIKRNEIHVTVWVNVETLCYVTKGSQKRLHIVFHICKSSIGKSVETESRLMVSKDWKSWRNMGGDCFGYGILKGWGDNENDPVMIVVIVAQLCEYTENHWIIYFKVVNHMDCKLYLGFLTPM